MDSQEARDYGEMLMHLGGTDALMELQSTKRDLADAIVGANEGLMRNLGREDLELLLS